MPAATPYDRQYNFQDFQAAQPTTPLPADKVDSEFDHVKITLDEILSNLGLIQRADGALANGSVGLEQLSANLTLGIDVPTIWETEESYSVLNAVFVGSGLYRCEVAHISGDFTTDFIAGKWVQLCDFGDILVAGNNGWSPVFAIEADGDRRVLKVADWVGGAGVAPDAGVYVGADGFEDAIGDAADVRGAAGANGVGTGTVVGPVSSVADRIATYTDTSGELIKDSGSKISDLQLLSEKGANSGYASLDSGGKVPTSQLPAAVLGALNYQGTWNATTNTPTIPAASSGNKGQYYKVATAGTTTIDGIAEWAVNDMIVSNGATWDKIDSTDAVVSVAGRTGAVTLAKADVGLSSVDNTADTAKPVSTATQTALDAKSNITRTNTDFTADDTFATSHSGTIRRLNSATDKNYTVPLQSSVASSSGMQVDLIAPKAGRIVVVKGDPSILINSKSSKLKVSAGGAATLIRSPTSNEWDLVGDLET